MKLAHVEQALTEKTRLNEMQRTLGYLDIAIKSKAFTLTVDYQSAIDFWWDQSTILKSLSYIDTRKIALRVKELLEEEINKSKERLNLLGVTE